MDIVVFMLLMVLNFCIPYLPLHNTLRTIARTSAAGPELTGKIFRPQETPARVSWGLTIFPVKTGPAVEARAMARKRRAMHRSLSAATNERPRWIARLFRGERARLLGPDHISGSGPDPDIWSGPRDARAMARESR